MRFANLAAVLCWTVAFSAGCGDSSKPTADAAVKPASETTAKPASDAATKSASNAPLDAQADAAAKASTEAAIRGAAYAWATVKADAQTSFPDEAKRIEKELAAASAQANTKDYSGALVSVEHVRDILSGLAAKAASAPVTVAPNDADWVLAATDVDDIVEKVTARVAELTKSNNRPAGVTKDAVDQAKADLAKIKVDWRATMEAYANTPIPTAIAKAKAVKARLIPVMTALKMPLPKEK